MANGFLFLSKDLKKYTILTNENKNIESEISLSMFYNLLALRLDNIYVWQGAAVFAMIDNFANKAQLFNYADIPTDAQGRRKKCDCEAISYKDGAGVYYQRKLWLKTAKAESTDRHKRLTSTNFINFSNFFGGEDFESVCDSFGVMAASNCERLRELIAQFDYFVKEITGLKLLKGNGGSNYWTIGGISKAYYLELYKKHYAPDYQGNILKVYQQDHLQDKVFEFDMRLAHLLTPGMLYYRDNEKHFDLYKYDINSLFPSVEQDAPFLGIPRMCAGQPSFSEIIDKRFEYIYFYSNLHLRLKKGMPAIFKQPDKIYKGENEKDIFIDKIAFFRKYHDALLLFYDIVDYEKIEFYCMRRQNDNAIKEYVNKLYSYKVGCKKGEYDSRHYPLIKYLLNNLHGKLAQLSIVEDYDYQINSEGIITRKVKKLSDTWAQSHFDYLRGAWIYSYSQAEMLCKLYDLYIDLRHTNKGVLSDHIFYIDTDCIITDIPPEEIKHTFKIDNFALGEFKLECHYTQFQAYAPKTYAGVVDGKLKITAAGMKKKEIISYLEKRNIPVKCAFDYFNLYPFLPCTILKRTSEGCEYVTAWRPLGKGFNISDEEEGVLYDSDNFII